MQNFLIKMHMSLSKAFDCSSQYINLLEFLICVNTLSLISVFKIVSIVSKINRKE